MKTVSRLILSTLMGGTLLGLAVSSSLGGVATNPCPHATGGQAFFVTGGGDSSAGQQVTTHVGQSVEVHLKINLSDGTVEDVSEDSCTSFASGGHGSFNGEDYTPSAADANKAFPLYAFYHDMCTGQTWTFTVHLVVRP